MLAAWLEERRPELERGEWAAAFMGYPRLNLAAEPIAWTPFAGDLCAAHLALVSSAGLYIAGQPLAWRINVSEVRAGCA